MNAGPTLAPGPKGVPVLGSLPAWKKDTAGFLLGVNRDYGQVARVGLGPITMHLVTEPAAVQRVLVDNNSNYVRGTLYEQFATVMGSGLLTTDGPAWRAHRRTVQPVFLRKAVEALAPNIVQATNAMLDRWEVAAAAGQRVDLMAESLHLTLDTLSRSLFGYDITPSVNALRSVVDGVIEIMFKRGTLAEMVPSWLPTKRRSLIRATKSELYAMVAGVRARKDPVGPAPLLDLMESAIDEDTGRHWTEDEIRDEILTIYLAGHETTAVSLYWTLLSVMQNPHVLEELDAELSEVLSGRSPELADLDQLDVTRRVVDESLRMYPPIWIFPRDAISDDELGGYPIAGGSSVLLSPLVAQRDPRVWDEPDCFDPGRFTPEAVKARPRMSYFPYGAGARMCVGNFLAGLELRLILAMVTQRFHLLSDNDVTPQFGAPLISLRPLNNTTVELRARHTARAPV